MEKSRELLDFEELRASLRRGAPQLLVGIDVDKNAHVARIKHSDGRVLAQRVGVENTRAGFENLRERVEELRKQKGLGVVCAFEPSGGYQRLLGDFLIWSGYAVVQVSGVVANRNRQTMGDSWLKTDARDARNLVDLLRQGKIMRYSSFPGVFVRLVTGSGRIQGRVRRLRRIYQAAQEPIGAKVKEGFHWEAQWIVERLQAIVKERKELQSKIARILDSSRVYQLVQTIPGVGRLLGAILVVEIGDPQNYRHWRQVVKLAGLNLGVVESGQFSGTPRVSRQGKGMLRWTAYQAAVIASAKDPLFHQLYQKALNNRLGQKGAKKRALVKLAAKMLRIVLAVLRDQIKYAPELVTSG